jgi:hypothetical protein
MLLSIILLYAISSLPGLDPGPKMSGATPKKRKSKNKASKKKANEGKERLSRFI